SWSSSCRRSRRVVLRRRPQQTTKSGTDPVPVRILEHGATRPPLEAPVMNRTSRLFLMGSGFVLAAGLGTGLVAYYGGGLPTLASAPRSVAPEGAKKRAQG